MKVALLAFLTTTSLSLSLTISITAPATAQFVPSPVLPMPQVNVTYPPNAPSYGCCWSPTPTEQHPALQIQTPNYEHYNTMPVVEPYVPVPLQMAPLPADWIIPPVELPTHSPYWKQ